MNWEAVAAVGQVLGSIAVLVTLVYLAMQTRHANDEARRSFLQAGAEGVLQRTISLATHEHLSRLVLQARLGLNAEPPIFVQRLVERAGMTMEDAFIVYWDMALDWRCRLQFLGNVDGMTADERAEHEWPFIMQYKHDPVGQLWWESVKPFIRLGNPSQARYVEELLARDVLRDAGFYTKATSTSTA